MKKVVKKAAPKKVAPKKAAPKKKAAPVKGAWVPPWAKKAVEEKKTGEKYASKAVMAKHEKGESKKMRMAEGEIPKARKGGKTSCSSCTCKGKGCMKCGGKKYGDGGKTIKKVPANKYAKEQIFNLKKGSQEAKAAYVATNSGTVYEIKYPKSSNKASVLSMDTTGYSKGKPSYKLDFENGSGSVKSKTVKRKDVKPLLEGMKKEVTSMRKGGKKK